jgi:hypothetical protein
VRDLIAGLADSPFLNFTLEDIDTWDAELHVRLPEMSRAKLWELMPEICQPGWIPPSTTPVPYGTQPATPTPAGPHFIDHACFTGLMRAMTLTTLTQSTNMVPASSVLSLLREHNRTGLQNITWTPPGP